MNRNRGLQGKFAESVVPLLLHIVAIGWFIGCYVSGLRDKAAGQDGTPNFFWGYGMMVLPAVLPARWWRYFGSMPRTLLHGLVWAYFVHFTAMVVVVLASFAGAGHQAETALILLAPYYLLVYSALWWQQRTPAVLRT